MTRMWWQGYRPGWLRGDVIAGVAVWAVLVPEASAAIAPGAAAGILVYENVWAAPFAAALRRAGAQLVAGGRIPVQAILAALDATDTTES